MPTKLQHHEERKEHPLNKKDGPGHNQSERRDRYDRRDFKSEFSNLNDDTDQFVLHRDRRKMPERRLSNIKVEESDIVEEEFFEYLAQYQKQP